MSGNITYHIEINILEINTSYVLEIANERFNFPLIHLFHPKKQNITYNTEADF